MNTGSSNKVEKSNSESANAENFTPKFQSSIPRGFAESYKDSVLSQDSDINHTNRTSSDFSDHVNSYRSKIKSSLAPTHDDRLAETDCKCYII